MTVATLPAPRTARRQPKPQPKPRPATRPRAVRRRLIDPTTCEREYAADELEFMQALDRYKHTSGRLFPTCSEILQVVRSLGYAK
jgi:hypothetical protein